MSTSVLKDPANKSVSGDADRGMRIAILSIGETPRSDIIEVLFGNLDTTVQIDEFGLLDGLSEEAIKDLAPTPDDVPLSAFRHGRPHVGIGTRASTRAMARKALDADQGGYDLIILMSTGIYLPPRLRTPALDTQQLVDIWVECHVQAGHQVGVIYLIESQHDTVESHYRGVMRNLQAVELASTNSQLKPVVNSIAGFNVIVLNSVSYTGNLARRIERLSGKPVVTATQILAGNLKIEIERLKHKASKDTRSEIITVVPTLSRREADVLALACEGLRNTEIGERLQRSFRTVEVHRSRGLKKAGVRSIVELLRLLDAHRP